MDDWYESPEWLVYQIWAGVKEAKLQEINHQSYTNSHIASLVYNYIRDPKKTEPASNHDYLPFDFQPTIQQMSVETATIFMEVMEKGLVPPAIISILIDCGLTETIQKLAKK